MPSELDVYQPPKAEVVASSPAQRWLYTPQQVSVASFIGGPLAGCILIGSNQAARGEPRARSWTILLGVVATIVVLGVGFALPEHFPNSVLPIAYTGALYGVAQAIEQRHPNQLSSANRQPYWKVIGIGFACLVVLVVPIVIYVLITTDIPNQS